MVRSFINHKILSNQMCRIFLIFFCELIPLTLMLIVTGRHNISILMTRSMGDRYGPRSSISLPEISSYTIPVVGLLYHSSLFSLVYYLQFTFVYFTSIHFKFILLYFIFFVGNACTVCVSIGWILGCGISRISKGYGAHRTSQRSEEFCRSVSSEGI